jgi:iron transport multicopper oxidase
MPAFFKNDSMSPELCIDLVKARLTAVPATTYLYVGLEYGRECYAYTVAPSPEPTSLAGKNACTIPCMGNKGEKCGGRAQYNLWATGTSITGTVTGTGIWTTAPAVSTP